MLSCRLASGSFWLGIYLFLWWFLLVIFGLFLLHWRYELPCQDKLQEFHCTPILGCIRVLWLWLVFHPLGLGLDKALCGWNSVTPLCLGIEVICISLCIALALQRGGGGVEDFWRMYLGIWNSTEVAVFKMNYS